MAEKVTEKERVALNEIFNEIDRERKADAQPSKFAAPAEGYPDENLPILDAEGNVVDMTKLHHHGLDIREYVIDHSQEGAWLIQKSHKKHHEEQAERKRKVLEAARAARLKQVKK